MTKPDTIAIRSAASEVLQRGLLIVPLLIMALAVAWFAGREAPGEPRATPRGVGTSSSFAHAPAPVAEPPGSGGTLNGFRRSVATQETQAPIIVAARIVCSFGHADAAAASIKEFDGMGSVFAEGKSYWFFGDTSLERERNGKRFANATVAVSTDDDASDCVSMTFKTSDGMAEPLFPLREGETTAWPTGAVAVEPGYVNFYFARVYRTSPSEWHVGGVGLGRFDTNKMDGQRLVESIWDASSGFGDVVNGARSPILQGDEVFVFLHTSSNRHLLARVRADSMGSANAYSYWDGTGWSPFPADAKSLWQEPVTTMPAHNGLSVRYNPFLRKWLAFYDRDLSTVSVRVSDELTGPWSSEVEWLDCRHVFESAAWPCYNAEQNWQLARDDGRTLYVTVSSSPPYDVWLFEFRLGAAVHQWGDEQGRVMYGPSPPGDGYVDEGVSFYASDIPVAGFSPVYLWETAGGEHVYSPTSPGPGFTASGISFFAPLSSEVSNSMVHYEPVYRWDAGTRHIYSAAPTGLEARGYARGPTAFYAVCGDANVDGVGDCLQ